MKKGSENNKKKRSTITIGNGRAVAVQSHDDSRINTTLATIYRLQKRVVGVCVEYFVREDRVDLCYSYLIIKSAFSSYPAVGGRGSGASAHRCPLPWTARTDTARRAKADIESYRSTRSARDLVKVPYLSLPK